MPRSTWFFTVSFKDINKEFRKFGIELGATVEKQLESDNIDEKIIKNVTKRLSNRYPFAEHISVGRTEAVKRSIGKKSGIRQRSTGQTFRGVVSRKVTLSVGHVETLDKDTRISKLDRSVPARHKFEVGGNPIKKNTGAAASRYHLWRLFELPRAAQKTLTPTTKTHLSFTAGPSYDKFIHKTSVNWRSRINPATKAYYFLDAQREVYKQDQNLFKNSVIRGVNKVIQQKTRFHD